MGDSEVKGNVAEALRCGDFPEKACRVVCLKRFNFWVVLGWGRLERGRFPFGSGFHTHLGGGVNCCRALQLGFHAFPEAAYWFGAGSMKLTWLETFVVGAFTQPPDDETADRENTRCKTAKTPEDFYRKAAKSTKMQRSKSVDDACP